MCFACLCPAKDVNRLDDIGNRAINSAVMAGHSDVVTGRMEMQGEDSQDGMKRWSVRNHEKP